MTRATASSSPHPTTRTEYVRTAEEYLQGLAYLATAVDRDAVATVVERVIGALHVGRTVFVAGNGGSAASATHMVCDWSTAWCAYGTGPARIISLADNSALVTALANDFDFTEVFARPLRAMGSAGDLLVLLSVSGRSPNLVEAARYARTRGIEVIGMLGDPGTLAPYCDVVVDLGAGDYGYTEDLHMAINHIVVRALGGGGRPRADRAMPSGGLS